MISALENIEVQFQLSVLILLSVFLGLGDESEGEREGLIDGLRLRLIDTYMWSLCSKNEIKLKFKSIFCNILELNDKRNTILRNISIFKWNTLPFKGHFFYPTTFAVRDFAYCCDDRWYRRKDRRKGVQDEYKWVLCAWNGCMGKVGL